jgi:hypothetical protein
LYERISGAGLRASLHIAGQPKIDVEIDDISRGGMAVRHRCDGSIGTDTEIGLPGGETVRGRIARLTVSTTGFCFRQDQNSLNRIDRVIQAAQAAVAKKAA